MALSESLSAELMQESNGTRKILQSVTDEHFDWKPHAKSFTLGTLASHLAELPSYVTYIIQNDELDFAKMDYKAPDVHDSAGLMQFFDETIAKAKENLSNVSDETLMKNWTLRTGDHVIMTLPKAAVLRTMVMNHIVHHRAQLGVYLRLLDIPVPGVYGPTADEKVFG